MRVLTTILRPDAGLAEVLGVDVRSLYRWANGGGGTKRRSSELFALALLDYMDRHPEAIPPIRSLAHSSRSMGGMPYFIHRLLDGLVQLVAKGE